MIGLALMIDPVTHAQDQGLQAKDLFCSLGRCCRVVRTSQSHLARITVVVRCSPVRLGVERHSALANAPEKTRAPPYN
jgi:hypothetical protein